MKYLAISLFTTGLMTNSYAAEQPEVLKDETGKINYSVGYQIGDDFRQQEVEIRPEAVLRGIQDALSDSDSLMTPQEMQETMADLGKHVAELKQKKRQELQQRLEKNRQFLVDNAKRAGVITTASGLQYRVLEKGGGKHPTLSDKVLVHYRGKLIDGTVFDGSHDGKPTSLQVDRGIKGWAEALQLMQRGDHWQLYIPSELAYGERGDGAKIPSNSTLIFDVEVVSIQ